MQTSRNTDLVARFGGEEFVVLLPGTSGKEASMLGERVRRAIADETFPIDAGALKVTASVGVVSAVDADDIQSLLAKGDRALYQAKHNGRDRVETYTNLSKASLAI